MVGEDRDANRRADAYLPSSSQDWSLEGRENLARDPVEIAFALDLLDQNDEFIAGVPRGHVGAAERLPDSSGDHPDHDIPDGVTERVVDPFEVIDVDE